MKTNIKVVSCFDGDREIDLSAYTEDGTISYTSKTDGDSIIDGTPETNGKVLKVKVADGEDKVGKTATITITVNEAANYNPYTISVAIKAVDKYSQSLSFKKSEVIVKAGESFENELTGAKTEVSYKSSDEKVAAVDSGGRVTALAEGSATITASTAETDEYFGASAEYKINVTDPATIPPVLRQRGALTYMACPVPA